MIDIVVPVYNEGESILQLLGGLERHAHFSFRVLICYDFDSDTTLSALDSHTNRHRFDIVRIKNPGVGPSAAMKAGFSYSSSEAVLVIPADDSYNLERLDTMVRYFHEGAALVCPSRFMPGGRMEGCSWLKAILVRVSSFTLYYLAGLPSRDATNGFRLFSRRLLERVEIESTFGFALSLELLVKCHRLGWPVVQLPALWYQRRTGTSRFRVFRWLPDYLRWYLYAFETRLFRRFARPIPNRARDPKSA